MFSIGLLLSLLALAAPLSGGVQPGAVPPVLLDAPLNLTWAANHTDHFLGLGFEGFLVHGVVEQLETGKTEDGSPTEGNALAKEIRLAQNRLADAGLGRNFLYMGFGPEGPWFSDREAFRCAIEQWRRAAAFCRETGLRGVALDTRPHSQHFDFRWDGYDLQRTPRERIRERARDLGRSGLRAFIREHPDTEILLLGEELEGVGPLWLAFFTGLVESVGAAETIPLHLALRLPGGEGARPLDGVSWFTRQERLVVQALPHPVRSLWQRQGHISMRLLPFSRDPAAGLLQCPVNTFRSRLCSAKTLSGGYVLIGAPSGGWWTLTPQEAGTYTASLQGLLAPSGPMPALGEYHLNTPLDTLTRVGPYTANGTPGYVFRSETGAAWLTWEAPAQSLVLEDRRAPIEDTGFPTLHKDTVPLKERRTAIPGTGAIRLIDGLPARDWSLPAALVLSFAQQPAEGLSRVSVRLSFRNPTALVLDGRIEAWPPGRWSMGAASFPIHLEPGETWSVERTVQGIFQPGRAGDFKVSLTLAGGGVITRAFGVEVLPESRTRFRVDGPVLGPPDVADLDGDGMAEVVFCSRRGDLHCLSPGGALHWDRHYGVRFDTPARVVRGGDGALAVLTVDHRGTVRLVDHRGRPLTDVRLGSPCIPSAVAVVSLPGADSDVLLAGLQDQRIVCMPVNGPPLWEHAVPAPVRYLTAVSSANDASQERQAGAAVVLGGGEHTLFYIEATGQVPWQCSLGETASCPPLRGDQGGCSSQGARISLAGVSLPAKRVYRRAGSNEQNRTPEEILVGTTAGNVQYRSLTDGALRTTLTTGSGNPVLALAVADLHPETGAETLVADGASLACYTATGSVLWRTALPGITGMTVHPVAGQMCIVVCCGEGLILLDTAGAAIWRDTRSPLPLSGSPTVTNLDGDTTLECAYASQDGYLRVIRLGPVHARRPIPAEAFEQLQQTK